MHSSVLIALVLSALTCCPSTSAGAGYPSRPVRVIVPFAAGGTFDQVARVVSQRLTGIWAQQVIVDNRPGGGTIIATDLTAKATPDGHTIFLSPNALAANPALRKKLPYDTKRDLKAVVLIAAQPMALGAHPTFRAKTIRDLLEIARQSPASMSYGSAGVGSGGHLAGEIFKSMAGIDITHVSYKGGNVAMMDVVANQIPLVMTGLPNLLPLHRAGRIRILGVTSSARSAVAKDIPSIGETVRGYDFKNWFGFVVPAGTPKSIVEQLNRDVNSVLRTDARESLQSQGFEIIGGSVGDFEKVIASDTEKFAAIIRQAGIEPQ